MKKFRIIRFVLFGLCLVSFYSCQREENLVPTSGYIAFSLEQKNASNGRIAADSEPAAVVVSIRDEQGKFIYENHKLPLLAFGQSYVSESLKSGIGSFTLTSFLILNSDNKIIYATPVENSDMAQYVNDALPLSFSVSKENTTQVVPEVIAVTDQDTPESFGYASFGFAVVEVPETIPLKVNLKFRIGEIIYENIEAPIQVKGFDADNNEEWSKVFQFTGPADNVIEIKKGLDHYKLSTSKWGITDSQTITAQQLYEDRANGPLPTTYGLAGIAPAKKLAYYINYHEKQGTEGKVFQPEYKVEYQYDNNGKVEKTQSFYYDDKTSKFVANQYSVFTWAGTALAKLTIYDTDKKVYSEDSYQYGDSEGVIKITQRNNATNITMEMSLNYGDNGKATAAYKFSNGGSFDYQFVNVLKNRVSDKTTRGWELCSEGAYTFDRNINPFRHLGYVDILLREYSINNTLSENVNYVACSFPAWIPETYSYIYDNQGYPTTKAIVYRGSGSVRKTEYFYQ